ncbi:hypothetical protein [Bosea sp. NBC_00550]|uniref:hypothetical protein n=1 Tax=Bosea sp. NBC_00550 TaxID=2969621 RepID=UPI0022326227|nr:hypothetical protein [Bosea sp. NBC_00550]UZF93974.1 hypothetical protein NWE53_07225 [Bosea sp. NBC_00550]
MSISFSTSNWPTNLPVTNPIKPTAKDEAKQDATASASASSSPSADSIQAEFLKFARMTPEERVQKAILDKLGMTEEQFNKLDSKAKADVMAKVRDEMLKQMEEKGEQRTGALADITV